ncbi:hypothetical protein [Dyella japonica]|uniref:Alpha/beta hydrolase n=1 Tax=Dyella japonica A8 TaxID=1217721 RepID=A0A075K5W7_9GAMM|nr:hypothetical protein [Dyella japonica]AIF47573.1 hypothetical protein HY57_09965 [Dyella japonica A8]
MRNERGGRLLGLLVAAGIAYPFHASADAPVAAPPATDQVITGTLQGAPYRIDIPAHWNGDLVMLMHGYEPKGTPRQEPRPQNQETPVFLARGYAVAASAYASQGWAVAEALTDNEQLRQLFAREHGKPHRTYVVGFSLGGLDALATLEANGHHYNGALSMCGVNVSSPDIIARAVVTPLVAFDANFPGVLPDLADAASPAMIDPQKITQALQADPAKAATLEARLQETDATLPGALMLYYMVLREIEQRAGGMPVDTTATTYHDFGDDQAFNQQVRRYKGSPSAMAYLAQHVTLTGKIDAPTVLQWNVFDPTVPSRFHGVYPELVRTAGRDARLTVLPPVGQGHCEFTPEQIGAAFDVLVQKAGATKAP